MLHAHRPAGPHPLTPITTRLKTFSVWVVFSLSFPQFLMILVSAPGTEETAVQSYRAQSRKLGSPSSSQRVRVQALVSVGICCCALEQDAASLPFREGVSDPAARRSVGREKLQGSIKYRIMFFQWRCLKLRETAGWTQAASVTNWQSGSSYVFPR